MSLALEQAHQAQAHAEVPVGAVVVKDDRVIGRGFNQPIGSNDPTAHAEIVALRDACDTAGNYRLPEARLYVTLEPCMMCIGAIVHAHVGALIYGATEPKAGAVHTHQLAQAEFLNHRLEVLGGVMRTQCGSLLSDFFASRRRAKQID